MKNTTLTTLLRRSALVVGLLGLFAGSASAQTYNLVADQFTWNGSVPMWGFAADVNQACGLGGPWTLGPMLEVDAATSTGLTVNLRNCLPEPVSIVIPGQAATLAPVRGTGGRATSLTAVANAAVVGVGGTAIYTWTGLKPGTYLYHSGSNLAKQVQMGLYGALIVDYNVATREAYPGIVYDTDVVLVASEIDPAVHAIEGAAKPLDYQPKYFLVNGRADGLTTLSGPVINDRILIRMVNAGLFNYVPNLLGEYMDFVAEDGNPYPYAKHSYSGLLAAGKTMDALWTPVTSGLHYLYDRRLHLSTNGAPGGGLIASIDIGTASVPTANAGADQFVSGLPGTIVSLSGSATGGSGTYTSYSWALVGFPAGSTAALSDTTIANPTLTVDVPGTYTAELVVTDSLGAFSAPDSVNIFTNLPPVAVAGADQAVTTGAVVTLDGSGSYDPDAGDVITYAWTVNGSPAGTTAITTFTPSVAGTYTAELTVSDGELTGTDTVIITATVPVQSPPTAVDDFATVVRNATNVFINLVANDTDPDGDLNPNSIVIVTPPTRGGTAVAVTNGVNYTPKTNFRGTETFTYTVRDAGGRISNVATVRVNVVKP